MMLDAIINYNSLIFLGPMVEKSIRRPISWATETWHRRFEEPIEGGPGLRRCACWALERNMSVWKLLPGGGGEGLVIAVPTYCM